MLCFGWTEQKNARFSLQKNRISRSITVYSSMRSSWNLIPVFCVTCFALRSSPTASEVGLVCVSYQYFGYVLRTIVLFSFQSSSEDFHKVFRLAPTKPWRSRVHQLKAAAFVPFPELRRAKARSDGQSSIVSQRCKSSEF